MVVIIIMLRFEFKIFSSCIISLSYNITYKKKYIFAIFYYLPSAKSLTSQSMSEYQVERKDENLGELMQF
jgi:hypothetical protein